MELEVNRTAEPALRITFRRNELPIFQALLERASFNDIRPEQQAAVFDLIDRLRQELAAKLG